MVYSSVRTKLFLCVHKYIITLYDYNNMMGRTGFLKGRISQSYIMCQSSVPVVRKRDDWANLFMIFKYNVYVFVSTMWITRETRTTSLLLKLCKNFGTETGYAANNNNRWRWHNIILYYYTQLQRLYHI